MIILDFETCSAADLKKVGIRNYANDPSTDILMFAWTDLQDKTERIYQWFPGNPLPSWCITKSNKIIYAHNVEAFEYEIFNRVLVPKYGAKKIKRERWEDVAALCSRFSFPRKLESVCDALGLLINKDPQGFRLMSKFSFLPSKYEREGTEWEAFCRYNKQDIEVTKQVLLKLPALRLDKEEKENYLKNWNMNLLGVPIDLKSSKQIYKITNEHKNYLNEELQNLTEGDVTSPSQRAKILTWLKKRGIILEDLQKKTVKEALKSLSNSPQKYEKEIRVLQIRKEGSSTSIGKYLRIIEKTCPKTKRLYHNSIFYGAHTGRITGTGFQLLNLPRECSKNPEDDIKSFFENKDISKNTIQKAKSLIRSMLYAPKNKILYWGDYAGIEYIILMWLANEDAALDNFKNRQDPYVALASSQYGIPPSEISKDQRQMGKIGVLGCGYGLGAEGFIKYAEDFGVSTTLEEARKTVNAYRTTYKKIPKLWYDLSKCALYATQTPGQEFRTNRTSFLTFTKNDIRYLRMTLASGRPMFYVNPMVDRGPYGVVVSVEGVSPLTKRWSRKKMSPGKWAENVVQALGRDILNFSGEQLELAKYTIIATVYDEIICEVNEDRNSLQDFISIMSRPPHWAENLPIRVDGVESKRYGK